MKKMEKMKENEICFSTALKSLLAHVNPASWDTGLCGGILEVCVVSTDVI